MGRRVVTALVLCLSAVGGPASALEPGEMDARAILQAVASRDHGDGQLAVLDVTVTHASGRHLKRVVHRSSLDSVEGTRTLLRLEEPAALRDTAVLSVDYRAAGAEDELWLYLPHLDRVTRISSAHKTVSVLGTDLTYADLLSQNLDMYASSVVEFDEQIDGEDCWVIELRPRAQAETRSTGYVKSRVWVSKQKLLAVQAKHWVENGRKLKYLKHSQFEEIDGIWVARRLAVRVVKTGRVESTTVFTTREVRFEQADVTAERLSVEGLRGSGR